MAQASFIMGSSESVVRADISYAAGQATSTSLAFSPQTGGGGAESGGPPPGEGGSPSPWTQIGTETIPVIVNLSADGSTELSSGETRQFNGQLQAEVWDIWTDGAVEHRSFNYVTYLPWTSLTAEIVQGDGWLGTTSLTTDGSGWFSSATRWDRTPRKSHSISTVKRILPPRLTLAWRPTQMAALVIREAAARGPEAMTGAIYTQTRPMAFGILSSMDQPTICQQAKSARSVGHFIGRNGRSGGIPPVARKPATAWRLPYPARR
jgi:hypothetical protein